MKYDRMFNFKTMGFRLWSAFILFSAAILIFLWLMQIVFMRSYYEIMKTSRISKVGAEISKCYGAEDFQKWLDEIAFKNSLLAIVTDMDGEILFSSDEHSLGAANFFSDLEDGGYRTLPYEWSPNGANRLPPESNFPGGALGENFRANLRQLPRGFMEFMQKLSESAEKSMSYVVTHEMFNGKTLIYGTKLTDAVLYLSAPLDPVDSTTDILKTQLIYVTIIALLLSFSIAFFIARQMSRPIGKITQTAGELARGNYDITFENGFYAEVDELAAMLNHTTVELQKVEKLRRELIANVSHDLRTPLTMIKAYSELIRDISGEKKEKREAHLKIIIDETDRLATLVSDILDISALESPSMEKEVLNLSEMVAQVLSRFQPLADLNGYIIKTCIQDDMFVMAEHTRMEQSLYNLIGNAINYIGEDKTIFVSFKENCGSARFEVRDNGEGIPEYDLNYIWERYYRTKNHKRSVVGTGLGLSIVKSVLEAHGARYGVESQIGEGSMFWFEIKLSND